MIDGLVGGRLYGEAQIRTGQNGRRFVTCKVRATTNDGDTIFVNVIAFDDDVQTALLALSDADSVALSGTLTPKVWTDKNGLVKPARGHDRPPPSDRLRRTPRRGRLSGFARLAPAVAQIVDEAVGDRLRVAASAQKQDLR